MCSYVIPYNLSHCPRYSNQCELDTSGPGSGKIGLVSLYLQLILTHTSYPDYKGGRARE